MPRLRFTDAFVQSFWQRFVPELPPLLVRASVRGPCLIWQGAVSKDGHGKVQVGNETLYTHRVAFEIEHGREPGPLLRHLCGVAACGAPAHLREGTDRENLADQVAHGTYSPPPVMCGEAHPEAVLSDADVGLVFELDERDWTQQQIADEVGCSQTLVSAVLRGERGCRR